MAIVLKSSDRPASSAEPDATTPRPEGVTGLAGFNLDDLAQEGRRQLEACRRDVAAMLDQARRDAESIRADAEREGYQAGVEKASTDYDEKLRKASEARARDQLASLTGATGAMRQAYEAWMTRYAEILSTTAIAAAEKVIGRELGRDRELLVRWARRALHSTRSAQRLSLVVHPETLAELGPLLDDLLASPEFPEQTEVRGDESVARHDVIVRQDGGEIEAGLTAQLDRLRESLQ